MSLGGGYSQALNNAVKSGAQAGIVFVVAAGNENDSAGNYSPASEPSAIAVSALADSDGAPGAEGVATSYGADDTFATFSNYGDAVDIAAPGVDILSTFPGGGYAIGSGTSMAAPHVAGAAALYMAFQESRPTVSTVTAALLDSGWTFDDTCCYFTGDRDDHPEPLLNVARLVGTVGDPPSPAENQPPTAAFTYNVSDFTVHFTDASTDSDGSIESWDWNFGDGITSTDQHPSHTYLNAGTYTVTLTVTDNENATDTISQSVTVSDPPQPGTITLSAQGYKVRGRQHVDLTWSGAAGDVNVYRDGNLIATGGSSGSYTDAIGAIGGGSYTYKVCEASGAACSNEVTVTF
jgi:subtilisin